MLPTLALRTFGGLFVEKDGLPLSGAAARRRPLALLAYVAASGDAGISREVALARLWPDSDEAKARNNLKQAVFALRRDLGDVFAPSATTLRVERSALAVDVLDLADAIQRDDLAVAVGLYRGPFLDGFSIPDLGEFERWVDEQRQRHAGAIHRVLETLAERARRAGDLTAAVDAWRRRAAMDPLSGRATAGLMRALRDVGDHTAALDLLRVHEVLVRDELGAVPDPALVALAAEIRRGFGVPPAPSARPAVPAPTGSASSSQSIAADPSPEAGVGDGATVASPAAPAAAAVVMATPTWREALRAHVDRVRRTPIEWPRDVLMLAVALVAPFITWRLAARPMTAEAAATGVPSLIAVLPFAVRGDVGDQARLGAGVADLVAVALNGADRFRTVPPSVFMPRAAAEARDGFTPARARALAEEAGAGDYLTGEIVRDGRRLHVMTALHSAGALVASASADGAADEVGSLVDRLAVALVAQRLNGPGDALARAAAMSTTSLVALKAWMGAERDYDDQRFADAVAGFERAVALDSTFALAHYRLANAADAQGDGERALRAATLAVRFGDALPISIRELVTAWRDWRTGDVDAAEARFEAIVEEQPGDAETWLRLGELRFRDNPTRGRSARGARAAFERVVALEPGNAEALLYLARIASLERQMGAARTYAQRAREAALDTHLLGLRAVRTFAIGDGIEPEDAVRARVIGVADSAAIAVAIHHDDVAELTSFAHTLLASAASEESRALGLRLTAEVAAAHARWSVASVALDSMGDMRPAEGVTLRALLAAQPFFQLGADQLRAVSAALAAHPPDADGAAPWHHAMGMVAAARGDAAGVGREIAILRAMRGTDPAASLLAASLGAREAERAGRLEAALAALDPARGLSTDPRFGSVATSDRYLRAELLHRLGRDDAALGWYASIAERASFELPWLAPAELRLAQIREQRGEAGPARQHYLRFLTLWQQCDPPLRTVTADAARALARLGVVPATR